MEPKQQHPDPTPRLQNPRLTRKVQTGKLGQATSKKAIHEVTDSLISNFVP